MTATTSAPTPITAPDAINVKIGEYIYEIESLVATLKEKVDTASRLNETDREQISQSAFRMLSDSSSFRSRLVNSLDYALLASSILESIPDYKRLIEACIKDKIEQLTSRSLHMLIANATSTAISNHIDLLGQAYVDKLKDEALLSIVDREAAFKALIADGPSNRTSRESWIILDGSRLSTMMSILRAVAARDDRRESAQEIELPWYGCFAIINDDSITVHVDNPDTNPSPITMGYNSYYPIRDASELDVSTVGYDIFNAFRNHPSSVLLGSETWLDRFQSLNSPNFSPRFKSAAIRYLRDHPDFEADFLEQARRRIENHF